MILHPYQQQAVADLRKMYQQGRMRPILCLPTGGGKTVTFCFIASSAISKGKTVWVVVDRTELRTQAQATLKAFNLHNQVQVHMVETLCRRNYPPADFIIIDECHVGNFRKLVDMYPATQMLGVTATPISSSKKQPLNLIFDDIVCPVSVKELINTGFLSTPSYVPVEATVKRSDLKLDAKGEFTEESQTKAFGSRRLVDGLDLAHAQYAGDKTIVFVPSVADVEKYAKRYNGIPLHSKMKGTERDYNVSMFRSVKGGWLFNCGIATRGFDVPQIRNGIIYRKTTSIALWLQMLGRAGRTAPGKGGFNIFDFGGNVDELGTWEMDRDWVSIFRDAKPPQRKKKGLGAAPVTECEGCGALIAPQVVKCPYCGHVKNKEAEDVAVKLGAPITYGDVPSRLQKPFSQMTVQELIERARYGSASIGRPYKQSWVVAQLKKREDVAGLREYARLMGYKHGWLERQLDAVHR